MGYFDDLRFFDGDIYPDCRGRFDLRLPGSYSLELKLGGSVALGRDGGRPVVCTGPVLFWHHPSHRYQYGPAEPDGYWHHHWVLFAGERGRRLIEDGFDPLSPAGWLPVQAPTAMGQLFRELVSAVRSRDPARHATTVILLERILALAQDQAAGSDPEVKAVAEAIRSDPFKTWDWDLEARSLGLSTAQFRRRFRKAVGSPPHACLLRARMHAAADRLAQERPEITALALDCGFVPAHFSRCFRAVMGVTPMAYRDRRAPRSE